MTADGKPPGGLACGLLVYSLVLINDDDFGAFGGETVVVRLPNINPGE